jgi:hypothetical protein
MKLPIRVLFALAALALVVAGCGGDQDEGGSEGSANGEVLTKAEFIKRADEICEQVDETQKAAFRNYTAKHPDAIESQSVNEELVSTIGLPPLDAEARQLDALPVPEGDEPEVQAIVEGLEEAVRKVERNPALLVNLKEGAGPFEAAGKLAGEYGLKACSLPL